MDVKDSRVGGFLARWNCAILQPGKANSVVRNDEDLLTGMLREGASRQRLASVWQRLAAGAGNPA
jgi:hypothetical protein